MSNSKTDSVFLRGEIFLTADQLKDRDHMSEMDQGILENICFHEAGHAIMRRLVGYPATRLIGTQHGGICCGEGKKRDFSCNILIALAGFAAEARGWYRPGLFESDLAKTCADDLDSVSRTLGRAGQWHYLDYYLQLACGLMFAHLEEVELLGNELEQWRDMSARQVAGFMRRHRIAEVTDFDGYIVDLSPFFTDSESENQGL